tara:strand:+ start:3758 stop:4024 length:267 start_codon:yes stop_codon:yes gene_type:complete
VLPFLVLINKNISDNIKSSNKNKQQYTQFYLILLFGADFMLFWAGLYARAESLAVYGFALFYLKTVGGSIRPRYSPWYIRVYSIYIYK